VTRWSGLGWKKFSEREFSTHPRGGSVTEPAKNRPAPPCSKNLMVLLDFVVLTNYSVLGEALRRGILSKFNYFERFSRF
jgi:hypothetical protein